MDDTTFDLLLSPKLLVELAPRLGRSELLEHLGAFLSLLQAEKAKGTAASSSGALSPQDDTTTAEVTVVPPADNLAPPVSQRLANRKQGVLQLLSLQLCCRLDWNLSALSAGLTMGQQQQLFDCLTSATATQRHLAELSPESVTSSVASLSSSPGSVFALALFFRWVVHSACALSLPVPMGSKAQIHLAAQQRGSGCPALPIPAGGGGSEQGGLLHQWLARLVPLALKVLQALLDQELHCALPTMESVTLAEEDGSSLRFHVEEAKKRSCLRVK